MRRATALPMLLLAALLTGACDDEPAAPRDTEPLDDVALVSMLGAGSAGPDGTFACPAGGETRRTHQSTQTFHGDTIRFSIDVTIEHRGCAVEIEGDRFILDGSERMEGTVLTVRDRDQGRMLSSVMRRTGRMRIRFRDYDRTCDFDLTQAWEDASGTYRVTGRLCGDPVDFVLPLPRQPVG